MMSLFAIKALIVIRCLHFSEIEGYVRHKREATANGPSAEPGFDLIEKVRPYCHKLLEDISRDPDVCTNFGSKVVTNLTASCNLVINDGCSRLPKKKKLCRAVLNQLICFDSPDEVVLASDPNASMNADYKLQFETEMTNACQTVVQPTVNQLKKANDKYGSEKVCDKVITVMKDACKAGVTGFLADNAFLIPLIPFLPGYICS